ncbi:MAG TPA: addiction module protein [Planctomycetaceae bacterium]|nr:addiction module protein [Planctomycetaceae bacterium]
MTTVLEQAMVLSVDEKLQLIEALWDSMARNPESIPVPDWQILELERRMESQRTNPQPGQSWIEVKREILDGKTQKIDGLAAAGET